MKPKHPHLVSLGACLLLGACAIKPLPWQTMDGQPVHAERLAQAKQQCSHDEKLKRSSKLRADAVMIARYEGAAAGAESGSRKYFDQAAVLRQEVSACMKAQGFVLPAN
ncbi:hypothetical protein [Hydrogenophaga taeniospiralis]|uniref:hypothetical protein n=1 Tax=Hydrogenophaga taeniospiralis TaxID=65656 RepID=UPI0012F86C74|nr:hypothetical protein [Hydrogenophaga taeniospiralis]